MSYYKEPKDINKSIRITKTVYEFIDQQEGKGFNEKLERMVLKYRNDEKMMIKRLSDSNEKLIELDRKISERTVLLGNLDRIKKYLELAELTINDDMPHLHL